MSRPACRGVGGDFGVNNRKCKMYLLLEAHVSLIKNTAQRVWSPVDVFRASVGSRTSYSNQYHHQCIYSNVSIVLIQTWKQKSCICIVEVGYFEEHKFNCKKTIFSFWYVLILFGCWGTQQEPNAWEKGKWENICQLRRWINNLIKILFQRALTRFSPQERSVWGRCRTK